MNLYIHNVSINIYLRDVCQLFSVQCSLNIQMNGSIAISSLNFSIIYLVDIYYVLHNFHIYHLPTHRIFVQDLHRTCCDQFDYHLLKHCTII